MKRGLVTALVGAQFGSEGKGAIAAHLANRFGVHVRTGGPNAGHTIYHEGRKWKMRSVPCGWVNPNAALVIGAGAMVDLEVLQEEVVALEEAGYDIASRLYVDAKATVISKFHRLWEGGTGGEMHQRMGSTGEGVGIARIAKIARQSPSVPGANSFTCVADHEIPWLHGHSGYDTVGLLYGLIRGGASVLLEGTQGSGLSLTHGSWPHVTSADTNAAQLCADAGISPRDVGDVILVARTHPIRVAGASGPLPNETSWEELGLEPEITTVTEKVRRVAEWDDAVVAKAIMLNGPTSLALTFLDYVFPEISGTTSWTALAGGAAQAQDYVERLERRLDVPVSLVGTGPQTVIENDRVRRL